MYVLFCPLHLMKTELRLHIISFTRARIKTDVRLTVLWEHIMAQWLSYQQRALLANFGGSERTVLLFMFVLVFQGVYMDLIVGFRSVSFTLSLMVQVVMLLLCGCQADLNHNMQDDPAAFYGVTSQYESSENMTITCSTKVCSFGKQVVEKVEVRTDSNCCGALWLTGSFQGH